MVGMANLRDQFAHLYPPSEDDVAEALITGLVIPDTNVLLSLYCFRRVPGMNFLEASR